MTHVLVATDGSGQSLKAAREVRTLLGPALRQVSVVAVVRPLASVPFVTDFDDGDSTQARGAEPPTFRESAQRAADQVAAVFADDDATVQTYVRAGRPAEEIIRAAHELDVGLVAIGGRGKGAVEAVLLGSVAYRVLHHAPCAVLVTH